MATLERIQVHTTQILSVIPAILLLKAPVSISVPYSYHSLIFYTHWLTALAVSKGGVVQLNTTKKVGVLSDQIGRISH
jgi:hypothetical protein